MSQLPVVHISADLEADRMLLGGKATSLVTLTRAGARVPPAFVLTTAAYRQWADGACDVRALIRQGIDMLQQQTGSRLGDGGGLVVSVRSGAPVSMPGMMDTVLNAGLGRLGEGQPGYLYEARARFLWQFAELVIGLGSDELEAIAAVVGGGCTPATLDALENKLAGQAQARGLAWPQTPEDELVAAAQAVFASWQSPRAKLYRRMRKIDDSLGTSVTIQQMVFGNHDRRSGSGVAFTRNPTSGEASLTGEFLLGGQGEEVVAGRETGAGLEQLATHLPEQFAALEALGKKLEQQQGKVQEIEFTIDQGNLFVLQARAALLTARAAARIAVDLAGEGLLSRQQALAYAAEHGFDVAGSGEVLAVDETAQPVLSGLPVGGGVGVGRIALSPAAAESLIREGCPVVFVSVETSPHLLSLMQRSSALLTMRGGATSHAAVVAREVGIPCVVGIGADIADGAIRGVDGLVDGAWVTIDGDSGHIYPGQTARKVSRLDEAEATLKQWSAA